LVKDAQINKSVIKDIKNIWKSVWWNRW